MAEVKTKLGKRPCPVCGEAVHVRSNAQGTVSVSCVECDFSGFAKKGTKAHELLTAGFGKEPSPPAPAPEPARKSAGLFNL